MLDHVELREEEVLEAAGCPLVKHQVHVWSAHRLKKVHFCDQVDKRDLNSDQRSQAQSHRREELVPVVKIARVDHVDGDHFEVVFLFQFVDYILQRVMVSV